MKPTPLDVLAKERPPLDRNKQRFAISQLLSDRERRDAEMSGDSRYIEEHLTHDVSYNLRELGETVARELLGRGPHVVDFRFTREYSSSHRGEVCLLDTVAIPVQVRNSYSIVMMDSELERWRPPIRTPRLSIDERIHREMWKSEESRPTKKPSPPSLSTRLRSMLKQLSEPTVYDGPKATDKHHTI